MTSEQFAYWLQGFAELNDVAPSKAQWRAICDHLEQVFVKVTPRTSGYQCANQANLYNQADAYQHGLLQNAVSQNTC